MRHFAEHGFQDARVSDIAHNLGIAKGSVFQHFGSKNGLFFEAYKKAVRSLPGYMHAPADVRGKVFLKLSAIGWSAPSTWCAKTGSPTASRCSVTTART
jgi:AcrR family transcriptional regulator